MTSHPILTSTRLLNGYVLALDQYGKQMPNYCGPYTDVKEKIERDYPGVGIGRGVKL